MEEEKDSQHQVNKNDQKESIDSNSPKTKSVKFVSGFEEPMAKKRKEKKPKDEQIEEMQP